MIKISIGSSAFKWLMFFSPLSLKRVLRPFADPDGWTMDCGLPPQTVSRTQRAPPSLTRILLAISACSPYFWWQQLWSRMNSSVCVGCLKWAISHSVLICPMKRSPVQYPCRSAQCSRKTQSKLPGQHP